MDVFEDEVYSFSGSAGGYYAPEYTNTVGVGYSGAGTVRLGIQWKDAGNSNIGSVEDLGVFGITADGGGQASMTVPQTTAPSGAVKAGRRWKRESPFFQSSWNQLGPDPFNLTEGTAETHEVATTLYFRVKNESEGDINFTWALDIDSTGSGTFVNGSKLEVAGYTGGSSTTLEPDENVVLNASPSGVVYVLTMDPSEGTGSITHTKDGELTLLLGEPWNQTREYDLTRVFETAVYSDSGGYVGSGPYAGGGNFTIDIVLSDVPVATTLTLAYTIRNGTNQAQPIRLVVAESAPSAGDGGTLSFGNASITSPTQVPTDLSQQMNVVESDLSGRSWELFVGSEKVASGEFEEDGPFVVAVSAEVGGMDGGYAFVDGAWIPRGGGAKPLLDDVETEEPTDPEAAPDGQKPSDNEVVAGRATQSGVAAALGSATINAPDFGKVPGQKRVADGYEAITVSAGTPAELSAGSGQSSGFTFEFLGHTFNFDLNFHEAIGSTWVPLLRNLATWFLYLFGVVAAFRILSRLRLFA